jgi:DNA-binding MarR family transcriptional regulator
MLDRNSDISRLLDRMLRKDLIEKHLRPEDKRAMDIVITASGLALLKEIDKVLSATERGIFSLSEPEAARLSDLLDKCRG